MIRAAPTPGVAQARRPGGAGRRSLAVPPGRRGGLTQITEKRTGPAASAPPGAVVRVIGPGTHHHLARSSEPARPAPRYPDHARQGFVADSPPRHVDRGARHPPRPTAAPQIQRVRQYARPSARRALPQAHRTPRGAHDRVQNPHRPTRRLADRTGPLPLLAQDMPAFQPGPMANAVFTHADGSIYDDLPEQQYHFPQTYLRAVTAAVGDWIVYYEPRRVQVGSDRAGGRQAYFAAARVTGIDRDVTRDGHYYARIADYLPFPNPVPFRDGAQVHESLLRRPDGQTSKGAFGRSVRHIPAPEFAAILTAGFAGLRDDLGADDWAGAEQAMTAPGFHDPAVTFDRPILERLTQKPFRDAAFARQVKSAYGQTCALTGLRILNGGGRPEVQAAHIRPVADGGPDVVRNGIALSATAHWMFDRGLISVDDDLRILLADDHLPEAARALILPDRRLRVPDAAFLRPHRAYLAHHRARFKG